MADFDFSLHSLIRAVSDELIQSQRARIAGGLPALFEVEEFTIDVSFVATEKGGGAGGFDLKIIRANASMNYESSAVHKISLKMRALKPDELSHCRICRMSCHSDHVRMISPDGQGDYSA